MTEPSAGQPKASGSKPEAKVEAKPEVNPKPRPAAEAKPEADPEAEPKPEAKPDVAVLLHTTLGEILVAGLVKDPEDAGRIIAQGIIQTEARIAGAKVPEAEAEPEPEAKAKTPSASTPKAAE